jgi:hypothetical protein
MQVLSPERQDRYVRHASLTLRDTGIRTSGDMLADTARNHAAVCYMSAGTTTPSANTCRYLPATIGDHIDWLCDPCWHFPQTPLSTAHHLGAAAI